MYSHNTKILLLLLLLLTPGLCHAVNSFTDAHLALDFENASDLGEDTLNLNDFTNSGVSRATDYKMVGSGSGYFTQSTSDYMYIPHTSLSSGFPTSSTSDMDFTICLWVRARTNVSTGFRCILAKYKYDTADRSWAIRWDNSTDKIVFIQGHTSGTLYDDTFLHGSALSVTTWYHVTVRHDYSAKTVTIDVHDSSGSAVGTQASETYDKSMSATSADIYIGQRQALGADQYFDGHFDEVVMFDRVITDTEMANILAGTYSAPAATGSIVVIPSTQTGKKIMIKKN